MTKGKKKKNKGKKRDKDQSTGLFSPKAMKRLQAISSNPLVADVVAATLVSAASALRDSKRAQQLAANAGDELEELAHRGAQSGNALWQLALDVGRKSLEALAGENDAKPQKTAASKPKRKKAAVAPKSRKSTVKNTRSPGKRQARQPSSR